MGRQGKEELQTWATDESCQSGSLHEIAISRSLYAASAVGYRSPMVAVLSLSRTCAGSKSSALVSISEQLMKWARRGHSKSIWLKKVITKVWSRGVPMKVTRSSKYSVTPLKRN